MLTTYWRSAISGKRGVVRKIEEKKVNQKSKPKKKSQAVFLFAHDTSSAESHDDSSLLSCADHRRPSSCTDRTMLAPIRPSAQCCTAYSIRPITRTKANMPK